MVVCSEKIATMPAFPPAKRGLQNVKPDLMIDLSRKIADNAYDKKVNPDGIIDLGSAKNEVMLDDLEVWLKKHETAVDKKNCNVTTLTVPFELSRRVRH